MASHIRTRNILVHVIVCLMFSMKPSLQNKIWNLPDRSTILAKFVYDKEGKLAGPMQILPVRVRGPALILKTGSHFTNQCWLISYIQRLIPVNLYLKFKKNRPRKLVYRSILWNMSAIFLKHLCVYLSKPRVVYTCQETRPSLVQITACCLFGAKPLSKPILAHC